jgi:hypothetical protein
MNNSLHDEKESVMVAGRTDTAEVEGFVVQPCSMPYAHSRNPPMSIRIRYKGVYVGAAQRITTIRTASILLFMC